MQVAIPPLFWKHVFFSTVLFCLSGTAHALDPRLSILTEQAPDLGCDNVLDGVYGSDSISVAPGNNCVFYRLTVTNTGLEPVYDVVIRDKTPVFTVFHSSAICTTPTCIVTEPPLGTSGVVTGALDSMIPGEIVQLGFSVLIE